MSAGMVVMWVVLVAAAAVAAGWAAASERAFARRRLLLSMHGARADAIGDIGLSVLVPEGATLPLAEELLTVEYTLFEAVIVVDGLAETALLEALTERYGLFRAGMLPAVDGTRALYRSRKRRFRRLVVLDRPATGRAAACRAAAEAASYDYLLVLRPAERLTCGAVERVVCELAAAPGTAVLHSLSGARATVFRRSAFEAACAAGGGPHRCARPAAHPRRRICDPVTVLRRPSRALRCAGYAAALATAVTGAAAAPVWWVGAAWAAAVCLVLVVRLRVGQLRRTCG